MKNQDISNPKIQEIKKASVSRSFFLLGLKIFGVPGRKENTFSILRSRRPRTC